MTYAELWRSLTAVYDEEEARAVARLVLETRFGLTMADVLSGRSGDDAEMRAVQERLLTGEPVQYVLGEAAFGGRQFHVAPGVLIPRPETYELCQWIIEHEKDNRKEHHTGPGTVSGQENVSGRLTGNVDTRILDIGTGSGCIACTLAAELPHAEVTAWDISDEALHIARDNAERSGVCIVFERRDALSPPADNKRWDVIVSNPPYVCQHERELMARNVVDYEPHLALFVPDGDPLLFYRSIGRYALRALKTDGYLAFETSEFRCSETASMLQAMGFGKITVMTDQFGKNRFVVAAQSKGEL